MLRKDTGGAAAIAGPRTRKESLPCWTIEIYGGSMKPSGPSDDIRAGSSQISRPLSPRRSPLLSASRTRYFVIRCHSSTFVHCSFISWLVTFSLPSPRRPIRRARCNNFTRTCIDFTPGPFIPRALDLYRVARDDSSSYTRWLSRLLDGFMRWESESSFFFLFRYCILLNISKIFHI